MFPNFNYRPAFAFSLPLALLLLLLAGCGKREAREPGAELFKIVVQTDWYAQPEHGGFYQALATGLYRDAGLDVEILPGGPNALTTQKIAQGRAHFALGRSDDVIMHASRGVPLLIAGALMQKDPQAILFHRETGIDGFEDLDGRTLMATPGSAFIELMERKYDISINITPLDYGMSRFLADKEFIQQCFITNEPYYVAREGANPGTLLISDSGFAPYRVWYCRTDLARQHPDVVRAFNHATIQGWHDYLFGDPSAANAMIAERNPKMDPEFMEFSRNAMIANHLVTGDPGTQAGIGRIDPERLETQIRQLREIGMLTEDLSTDTIFNPRLLPESFPRPPGSSNSTAALILTPTRSRSTDLEIVAAWKDDSPPQARFLSRDQLESLPVVRFTKALDVGVSKDPAVGVLLTDLLAALPLSTQPDFVLADCTDKYQGNFTTRVMEHNQPVLVTHVGDTPLDQWAAEQENPGWGPYLIDILDENNLTDPVHKKPWGVTTLRLTQIHRLVETLKTQAPSTAGDWDLHHPGFRLFLANCASCHASADGAVGGAVSNRTLPILATFAKYNPDYFFKMLKDPVGTNPLAEQMPPTPHYSQQQFQQIRDWLALFAP